VVGVLVLRKDQTFCLQFIFPEDSSTFRRLNRLFQHGILSTQALEGCPGEKSNLLDGLTRTFYPALFRAGQGRTVTGSAV
jgi:hypothetical protein